MALVQNNSWPNVYNILSRYNHKRINSELGSTQQLNVNIKKDFISKLLLQQGTLIYLVLTSGDLLTKTDAEMNLGPTDTERLHIRLQ